MSMTTLARTGNRIPRAIPVITDALRGSCPLNKIAWDSPMMVTKTAASTKNTASVSFSAAKSMAYMVMMTSMTPTPNRRGTPVCFNGGRAWRRTAGGSLCRSPHTMRMPKKIAAIEIANKPLDIMRPGSGGDSASCSSGPNVIHAR